MGKISLRIERLDLEHVLATLSTVRCQRFKSILPVWMHFDPKTGLLTIEEERARVTGAMRAEGAWPPAGATVDLYRLKRALAHCALPTRIELIATLDAILVPTARGHVSLKLLSFGPETLHSPVSQKKVSLQDLPLFRWAGFK